MRLVPRGQTQRPFSSLIWPASSLHCGGASLRHSPRMRLVPRGQTQRPFSSLIWPGSSLHCGGWSLRHSPLTRLVPRGQTQRPFSSLIWPGQQLAQHRTLMVDAAAIVQLRAARADATSVLVRIWPGSSLHCFHLRRRGRRWRLAADRRALAIAEGGAFRADAAAGVVHDEALRALLHHLLGDGEGVAGVGLRSRPSGGLRRRGHARVRPRPPAYPAAPRRRSYAPTRARGYWRSGRRPG